MICRRTILRFWVYNNIPYIFWGFARLTCGVSFDRKCRDWEGSGMSHGEEGGIGEQERENKSEEGGRADREKGDERRKGG